MRILLIVPHSVSITRFQLFLSGVTPPLGVAYLASYLRKAGFEVFILDACVEWLNARKFFDYVKKIKPNIVGFSVITSAVSKTLDLARMVKEINCNIKVVIGGPHASVLSEDLLSHRAVDIIIKGEGEETFLELAVCLADKNNKLSSIKGIKYKSDNAIINNINRNLIDDLDTIPFPAYDLLPLKKYYLSFSRRYTNRRIGGIITSRGCSYSCSFCSKAVFGNSVRYRSPENVVSELESLNKKYDIGEITIWDDNFNSNQERAMKICDLIRKRDLDIIWSCNNRPDFFSAEFCESVYTAGCRHINFGIESAILETRTRIKKILVREDIERAIKLCKQYKLLVSGSFIIGLPGENREAVLETLRFAKSINLDYAMFYLFIPMPGSELFNAAVEEGAIDKKNEDWNRYVPLFPASLPVVSMCGLSGAELIAFQRKAFREFYMRPRYIYNALCRRIQVRI